MRILLAITAFCFLAGVWQHDLILMAASVALAGTWVLIGEAVRREM